MDIVLNKYHPYRQPELAKSYEDRAAFVAKEIADARSRHAGNDLSAALTRVQAREFGAMGDAEFRHRVSLAQALSTIRQGWAECGQHILDLEMQSQTSSGCTGVNPRLQLHPDQSVFIHLRNAIPQDGGSEIEGIYLKRVGHGSDETCILIMVGGEPDGGRFPTLGRILCLQSRILIALAPSLSIECEVELIDSDQELLEATDLQAAFEEILGILGFSPRASPRSVPHR